jgi:hypothetical protein
MTAAKNWSNRAVSAQVVSVVIAVPLDVTRATALLMIED